MISKINLDHCTYLQIIANKAKTCVENIGFGITCTINIYKLKHKYNYFTMESIFIYYILYFSETSFTIR